MGLGGLEVKVHRQCAGYAENGVDVGFGEIWILPSGLSRRIANLADTSREVTVRLYNVHNFKAHTYLHTAWIELGC